MSIFRGNKVLITGGSGSWGNELTRQLLDGHEPDQIRIYSRGEHRQVEMKRRLGNDPRLRFIIGDVRDFERLKEAAKGVDCIFHLAALKHVPVCEENPWEAVKTNIAGTQCIIDAALENGVSRVIDISTDKAVDPLNLYGVTKAVGEKLIVAANTLTDKTAFVCIRGGTVLGTTGSVVPLFRTQILKQGRVTITDEAMTRFFLNLQDAIRLIFTAADKAVGGEIFVMDMPAARISDVADVMIRDLGGRDTGIEVIGKRPGEKVHELLVSRHEAERAYRFGEYFMILPTIAIDRIGKHYNIDDLEPVSFTEYSSENARRLSTDEIRDMLAREDWLTPAVLPADEDRATSNVW